MNNNFYSIKDNQTVKNFIIEFEESIKRKKTFTAIKLDNKNKVIGVLTRGDLRRLVFKENQFNKKIERFLNLRPILIKDTELNNNFFSTLIKRDRKSVV
mgnify:FL=1